MAYRRFPKMTMIARRKPVGPALRWTFTRIWVACLPLSIAAVAGSILLSGGDPERRPFIVFGIGIVLGLIGLASLFVGLIQAGNEERARRRARDAARLKAGPKP